MDIEELKNRGRVNNVIAAGQSMLGLSLQLGHGMVPMKSNEDPAFTLEGVPVFHIGYNPFELDYDCIRKNLIKWGQFVHPFMMIGMPDVEGMVKLYVDASLKDYYLLCGRFQLDPSSNGPSYPHWSVICWTPRLSGDSRYKAGKRMFHAMVMHIDDLKDENAFTDYSRNAPQWERDWLPSASCLEVFRMVRK
jgi:hypothetical protein